MELHEKIKMLRREKAISQQELADKVGIHISHMSRLENGHNEPSLEVLKKLRDIFEVSADYLLSGGQEGPEVTIHDKSLAEKMRLVDQLGERDRDVLTYMIETMLTREKMRQLLEQGTAAV